MKKLMLTIAVLGMFAATSCGGGDGWEAKVEKWCELEKKIESAEGDERDKLKDEQEKIEEEIEKMIEDGSVKEEDVEKAAEACEGK
jgi:cell division protein FtsB